MRNIRNLLEEAQRQAGYIETELDSLEYEATEAVNRIAEVFDELDRLDTGYGALERYILQNGHEKGCAVWFDRREGAWYINGEVVDLEDV